MTFDFKSLAVSTCFSIAGLMYLRYGKQTSNPVIAVFGVLLMGFSYFVDDLIKTVIIGLILLFLPFLIQRRLM